MASLKRDFPAEGEPGGSEPKKMRASNWFPLPQPRVVLNPADCNLDFLIGGNGLRGSGLYEEGFAYCWSGARANVGIRGGVYCFGCRVLSTQAVQMKGTTPDQQHVCSIGISRGDVPVGNLGEARNSFGFVSTGKFSNDSNVLDYGEKFGVGDTIVCAVDLDTEARALIGYYKNGNWLGIAMEFDAGQAALPELEDAFFPHVLLKNVVVEMLFTIEDGLIPPESSVQPWNFATYNGVTGPALQSPFECEVIMLVGLPASGKTTWAEKWVKENKEKHYVILGINLVMDQMKVPGPMRKINYAKRFDVLTHRANEILHTQLCRAANIPQNYIIDDRNMHRFPRELKLKPFVVFRKIAVVVFPRPHDFKFRSERRFKEVGEETPAIALNSMIDSYTLPTTKDMPGSEEDFDLVIFTELNREDAQRCLDEMKQAVACPPPKATKMGPPSQRCSTSQSSMPVARAQSGLAVLPSRSPYRGQSEAMLYQINPYQGHYQYPVPGGGVPQGTYLRSSNFPGYYSSSGTVTLNPRAPYECRPSTSSRTLPRVSAPSYMMNPAGLYPVMGATTLLPIYSTAPNHLSGYGHPGAGLGAAGVSTFNPSSSQTLRPPVSGSIPGRVPPGGGYLPPRSGNC